MKSLVSLDVSKNKLRVLPDGIGLFSVKVFCAKFLNPIKVLESVVQCGLISSLNLTAAEHRLFFISSFYGYLILQILCCHTAE